jgi:hypothetical protein
VSASASRSDSAMPASTVATRSNNFAMSCVFGNSIWRRTRRAFSYFSTACWQ